MGTEQKHYVVFYSPGTLFAESTTKEIAEWDTKQAMRLCRGVVERYGAKPYGFQFETRIVAAPIPDGQGGTLRVEPKTVKHSCMYYINGTVETLAEIEVRNDKDESILLSNMRCNKYDKIVRTKNGYTWTQPFEVGDRIVNNSGEIQQV